MTDVEVIGAVRLHVWSTARNEATNVYVVFVKGTLAENDEPFKMRSVPLGHCTH